MQIISGAVSVCKHRYNTQNRIGNSGLSHQLTRALRVVEQSLRMKGQRSIVVLYLEIEA